MAMSLLKIYIHLLKQEKLSWRWIDYETRRDGTDGRTKCEKIARNVTPYMEKDEDGRMDGTDGTDEMLEVR